MVCERRILAPDREICPTRELWQAAHCCAHFGGEFANASVAQLPEAVAGLDEVLFTDHGDVLGAGRRVGLQASLAGGQENMRGSVFVDAPGKGDDEQGVGARVAIAGVDGDDHDGAAALFGRIGGKLNEPDFAAQRNAGGRR